MVNQERENRPNSEGKLGYLLLSRSINQGIVAFPDTPKPVLFKILNIQRVTVQILVNAPGRKILRKELGKDANQRSRKEGNLILKRKKDQSILIDDGIIEFTVLGVNKRRVRCGIKVPNVPIKRQELLERYKKLPDKII